MNILLVESDAARLNRVRQVLIDGGIAARLHTVGDAIETVAYLQRDVPYSAAPRPNLVLLGPSLRSVCVCDVLSEIRRIPPLHRIQVLGLKDERPEPGPGTSGPMTVCCCEVNQVDVLQLPDELKGNLSFFARTERSVRR